MIVIVGAGLAGLAAAHKLLESKITDFIIIEAQDYAGGRIKSVGLPDGSRLDLGAQWLHGERQNPIYGWLESLDCIDGPEEEEVEFEGLFVTVAGQKPDTRVISRVLEVLLETKAYLYKYARLMNNSCRPLDIFRQSVQEASGSCPILKAAPVSLVEDIVRWFELYEAIDNSSEDLQDLSIKAYSSWTDFDDGKMVKLKGGWQTVVDKMVALIGRKKIRFNTQVKQIHLQEDGKVHVKLENDEFIRCDYVISTLSVGVLKGSIDQFVWQHLDESRCDRIRKIGFGPVNKIFMQFAKPYLQQERGLKILSDHSSGTSHPEWLSSILGFDLVDGAPNVILVWLGGPGSRAIEKISDAELGETLIHLLKRCMPESKPPKLISLIRSQWSGNKHIGGGYSYPSLASVDLNMDEIWKSIRDRKGEARILFAGEATAGDMYATAHGAIMSGWREALRLISPQTNNHKTTK